MTAFLLGVLCGLAGLLFVIAVGRNRGRPVDREPPVRRGRRKVRTLTAWRGCVSELLEAVDHMMVQKHEGRDTRRGARPKGMSSCEVYHTPPKT